MTSPVFSALFLALTFGSVGCTGDGSELVADAAAMRDAAGPGADATGVGDAAPTDAGPVADARPLDGGHIADGGPDVDARPSVDAGPVVDAGSDAAATPDAATWECDACFSSSYELGWEGGNAPFTAFNELSPCRRFTHTRMNRFGDTTPVSCGGDMAICDATAVDVEDVLAALAHPDVVAAFSAAPILYGLDGRSFDASVFYISEAGGARFQVGLPCGTASGCTPIPPGVDALYDLMNQLLFERLSAPDCATTVFP